jgi:hypothetical protein
MAHDNDVVFIPEGYHPVSSPVAYTTLPERLHGAQSPAASDDSQLVWVKNSYQVNARAVVRCPAAKELVIG